MIATCCKHCGCTEGYLRVGDVHTGLYCSQCNSWIKWMSKNEVELLSDEENIIVEETNDVNGINIEELKKQRDELDKQINKYYKQVTKKEIEDNYGFIGKTYKRAKDKEIMCYYKILGVEENNQYRMKTLVFSLPVTPFAVGTNEYEETSLLDIKSIGWFCNSVLNYGLYKREIDSYTEISNEEYETAFNSWMDKIQEIVHVR